MGENFVCICSKSSKVLMISEDPNVVPKDKHLGPFVADHRSGLKVGDLAVVWENTAFSVAEAFNTAFAEIEADKGLYIPEFFRKVYHQQKEKGTFTIGTFLWTPIKWDAINSILTWCRMQSLNG